MNTKQAFFLNVFYVFNACDHLGRYYTTKMGFYDRFQSQYFSLLYHLLQLKIKRSYAHGTNKYTNQKGNMGIIVCKFTRHICAVNFNVKKSTDRAIINFKVGRPMFFFLRKFNPVQWYWLIDWIIDFFLQLLIAIKKKNLIKFPIKFWARFRC